MSNTRGGVDIMFYDKQYFSNKNRLLDKILELD